MIRFDQFSRISADAGSVGRTGRIGWVLSLRGTCCHKNGRWLLESDVKPSAPSAHSYSTKLGAYLNRMVKRSR
jgi:hypothetical protein